jgi:alpha-tubulin suppressor-like RCC1 family protein
MRHDTTIQPHNHRPWPRRWAGLVGAGLLACLLGTLAACGGGGAPEAGGPDTGGSGAAATGAATLGAAGGSVAEASGARVEVPAGALAADTTIRVAQDSGGAPALPPGLTAAGAVYALTPHGTRFAQPVQVHLPRPATPLAPNQVWKIAQAELGGSWQLLDNTVQDPGALTASVRGFSYFAVVVVTYPLPVLDVRPVALSRIDVLDCGGQACNDLVGPTTLHVRVVLTGSQVPSTCPNPAAGWRLAFLSGEAARTVDTDGSLLITVQRDVWFGPTANPLVVDARLQCVGGDRHTPDIGVMTKEAGRWRALAYPGLAALPLPASTETADGLLTTLRAVLMGGAVRIDGIQAVKTPSPEDSAVVEWQRSDDQGTSWRTVAQSFQHEADPRPYPTNLTNAFWSYWAVGHGFKASAADAGAKFRVRACYTPPDAPAPPCVFSTPTTLVVAQASAMPSFSTQPRAVLVRTGQTASFNAAAAGTPAPTLQWQTRAANSSGAWTDVAGATGASFTTAVLGLADNGLQVRAVASNGLGSAESAPVTVSVSDLDIAPGITTQPATIAVAAGGDAVFAVAARGTEALSYQWRFNGQPLTGANAPVLKLAAVTAAQAGRYSVVVSNGAGSVTSDNATLDVTAGTPAAVAPTIVTQPVSVLVNAGNTATLAVGVAGTGPFSYQWFKGGQPLAGATAAYYSVPAATQADGGSYAVQVSNAAGSASSWNVVITVNQSAAPQPVAITTQPSAQVQLPGGSATFAVAASGSGPFSYQWLKNGAPVAGANAAVLVLPNLQAADAGSYSVSVSNALGDRTSSVASLSVVGAPAISTPPAAVEVAEGQEARFAVQASGQGLRYQWLRNGVGLPGADQASYATPPATAADNGAVYSVIVYNGAGLVFSQGATLTLAAAPAALPEEKIAAGLNHSCAVRDSGTVYCWGNGVNGELGYGSAEYNASPVRALGLADVKAVAAGGRSSCAIDSSRALWCWGELADALSPVKVAGADENVAAVAVGLTHACYARADGTVWCWGRNADGQLGNGSQDNASSPVQVRLADGSPFGGAVAVAAGARTSCAQRADGAVWCWGADVFGNARVAPQRVLRRLPDNSTMDFTVTGRIAGGLHHTCGIDSGSGQPLCWGFNPEGQLGDGTTISRDQAMPTGLFGALRLLAGASHTCAIRSSDMLCWGTAFFGNGGARQTLLSPDLAGARVAAYFNSADPAAAGAAGERHTCVLRGSGDVQCWGWGNAGQMGNGDTLDQLAPVSTTAGAVFWRP